MRNQLDEPQSKYLSNLTPFHPPTMPPCPICGIVFVGRGFTSHLAKTTNALCVEARTAAENFSELSSDSGSDVEQFGQDTRGDFPTGGGVFQGDIFGENYTAEELGYLSDPDNSADNSDWEDGYDSDPDPNPCHDSIPNLIVPTPILSKRRT